jgi:hypothetical protein
LCRRSADVILRFVERNSGRVGSRSTSEGKSREGMTEDM